MTLPTKLGKIERREFNYIRHGTQVLTGNLNLATGELVCPTVEDTRTEADFAAHIARMLATDPNDGWIILCDQLNTHKSASLVEYIAEMIGDTQDLGQKDIRGVLKNMTTRQAYLEATDHRIRFVYTPKHCSWLNPIEVWFSIISGHILRRGNFASTADLKQKIENYIGYYNQKLAKPFRWSVITNRDIRELVTKLEGCRVI